MTPRSSYRVAADALQRFTAEMFVRRDVPAADADTVAYGQLWVKDLTPCELYFTTDAGDDIQLTSGTAAAVPAPRRHSSMSARHGCAKGRD